jgi:phospholipase C
MSDRAAFLRRAEAAERFEQEHPEAALRRREFLARTAAVAGGAALSTMLPAEALVAEAARRERRVALPRARDLPIDTVVVLMMENRSFDHYFGWYAKADGKTEGLSYVDGKGQTVKTYRLAPEFQGCGHPDPDHGWTGGRFQLNNGKMDGFAKGNAAGTGSDEFACGYYLKDDLGFISHAGVASTVYDRFFCSILASTYPNRHYMWAADAGGRKTNQFPSGPEGFPEETIMDRARSRGVTATYYNSDLPFSGLYGQRGFSFTQPIENYYQACRNGTLPQIAFVDPPFRDGGGGDGLSADEHPHGDVRLGQAFMSDVAHAFMESPQWQRGVLFTTYDEWGGFFDHVVPPVAPDQRRSRNMDENWGQMGFRIPTLLLSPYAKRGHVSHSKLGFESILKLISYRFGLGTLNIRHRYATNIARTMEWRRPNFNPPSLPDPEAVVTPSCTVRGATDPLGFPGGEKAAAAKRPKEHDMVQLETSGYLERLGYEVKPATFDRIFRAPDRMRRANRRR